MEEMLQQQELSPGGSGKNIPLAKFKEILGQPTTPLNAKKFLNISPKCFYFAQDLLTHFKICFTLKYAYCLTHMVFSGILRNEVGLFDTFPKQLGMLFKLFVANYFFVCAFAK